MAFFLLLSVDRCVQNIAYHQIVNYFCGNATQEFPTANHMDVENPIIQIPVLYIVFWMIFAVVATFAYAFGHLWWKQRIPKMNKIRIEVIKNLRSSMDRRSGEDRRKVHNIDYFLNGGIERRSGLERRSEVERRSGWVKVSEWQSVNQRVIATPLNISKNIALIQSLNQKLGIKNPKVGVPPIDLPKDDEA